MAVAGDTGASSSSSSSEPYDVFISFRGPDVRQKIISHLLAALDQKHIKTYFDEEDLRRGEKIAPALMQAIKRCQISVIVFSKDYASSRWCLRELAHILDCHGGNEENAQTRVLPIFYEVKPSDLPEPQDPSDKQKWIYEVAFKQHEEEFKDEPGKELVKRWKESLKIAAKIAGYDSQDPKYRPENTLVEEVVSDILLRLSSTVSSDDDFKGLIGFKDQFDEIESLLSIDSLNVLTLSIWGMGGTGKTTLAKKIFYRFKSQFHGCCFLGDVREQSEKKGLNKLRNKLDAELLKEKKVDSEDFNIKRRLRRAKVLIVLDDVSTTEQLRSLITNNIGDQSHRFGSGSRIIITTRDAQVVRGAIGDNVITYKVKQLEDSEGLQLFHLNAFKGNSCPPDFSNLSSQVVKKLGGNPLAINVLGSHLGSLRSQSKENWEIELKKLEEVPNEQIHKVLRISYDGLDKFDKKIFLDIACYFKGYPKDYVEKILNACGFFASNGIGNLIDKSLISVKVNNFGKWRLHMHDLLQEMGQNIVKAESEDPFQRSRLWIWEDVSDVLVNDKGSEKIEWILLKPSSLGNVLLKPTVFLRMSNLRFLILTYIWRGPKVNLEALEYLPPLRYLQWKDYPLRYLPSIFETRYLVELHMPYSKLEQLWPVGDRDLKALKTIDLSRSENLTRIPELSRALNLERIDLSYCSNLVEFPWQNLRNLDQLVDLNLSYCEKLPGSADGIVGRKLQNIELIHCSNFDTLPMISSPNLVFFDLSFTKIKELPSSICYLKNLSKLKLEICKHLRKIPSSMREMESLKSVVLSDCLSLEMFPELPRSIEEIGMSGTAIKEVPSSIEDCTSLRSIQLCHCRGLVTLPKNFFKLRSLCDLDLRYCSNLNDLPEISEPLGSLRRLFLWGSGIRQLPSGIENLTCLGELDLSQCKYLEYVPNNICNFISLTCLQLEGSIISEIPRDIKRLSMLKELKISYCKNIKLLPELPLSLITLEAIECTSLVSTQITPLIQGFWDDYKPTEEYLLFKDCLKLNENGQQNIMTDFQLRVLRMATRFVLLEDEDEIWHTNIGRPHVSTCLPGGEIPKWFSHQSDGSSICIDLRPRWHDNFLGFALSTVVTDYSDLEAYSLCCQLQDNIGGKFSFQYQDRASMYFANPYFDSDHMFMWYNSGNYNRSFDAVEARFSFSLEAYREEDMIDYTKNIKKCGIRILYRQDVDNQDVLKQSAARIPDQPEPRNVIDDLEAPHYNNMGLFNSR